MTYEEWFSSKQGEPYDSMYVFAKDAWQACYASHDDEVAEFKRQLDGHTQAWKKFGEERDELKRQRDEMLSVLEKFSAWNKRYPSSRIYSGSAIREITKELDQIAEEADAAISGAKGGA